MPPLTREAILGIGRRRELVEEPDFGGTVWVGAMSLATRLEWERWQAAQPKDADTDIPGFLVFTLEDAEGKRLLSVDDIPELLSRSAAALLRLFRIASRLSGMKDEEVIAAKGES